MKELKLIRLAIKNFKGLKDFKINPGGKNINIFGDNATGKTTISDSVSWLFFDKDSTGKSDFALKPTDKNNNEIHMLDTEVEGSFLLNNEDIILKKVFHEKWTKKRGSASKVFTGHETIYFINEVPEKKKAFDAKINELFDVNIFKIVTNPYEFNTIHWQERRAILFDIAGSLSDEEILEALFLSVSQKDDFSNLANILNKSSIEDHKKKIAVKRKDINKEIEKIPVRIDEVSSTIIKDLKPVNKKEKARLEISLDENEKKLAKLKANELVSEKKVEINKIDSEIIRINNDHNSNKTDNTLPLKNEIADIESNNKKIKREFNDVDEELKRFRAKKKKTELVKENFLKEYKTEKKKEFTAKTHCPTCKQELPKDEVEETEKNFNNQKAEKVKSMLDEGLGYKKKIEEISVAIKTLDLKVVSLAKKLKENNSNIKQKEKELSELPKNEDSKPNTSNFEKQKIGLLEDIKDIKSGSKKQEDSISEKIEEIKKELSEIITLELEHGTKKSSLKRIEELKEKESVLAAEYEKLESELFLIEKFIVKKVELLEDSINSKFKIAKFKLFKTQINGGVEDCCSTTFNGIEFHKGLNNAARINVGLDIIETLSEHYGFRAPVFIDNRESVNKLIPIDSQIISLIVSKDQKLTTKSLS